MWNAFQIILVLGLSVPERSSRRNLSHDFAGPQPRSLYVGDCSFGNALLFVAGVKDRGAILSSDVGALPIHLSWIVRN